MGVGGLCLLDCPVHCLKVKSLQTQGNGTHSHREEHDVLVHTLLSPVRVRSVPKELTLPTLLCHEPELCLLFRKVQVKK